MVVYFFSIIVVKLKDDMVYNGMLIIIYVQRY